MMKLLLILICALVYKSSFAQEENPGFQVIKNETRSVKAKSVSELAKKLTSNYKEEMEKVIAIFSWITENIRYDIKGAVNPANIYHDIKAGSLDSNYNDQIAQKVIKERKGVCDGYARLFKTLCDQSNIKSIIIEGYIRGYSDPVGIITYKRHAWNAVSIDGKWHLLDATWASGSRNGDAFVKQFNSFYFLTDPIKFFNDHFPDDSSWALFPNPPTLRQFYDAPYISQEFYTSNIISYQPTAGIIEPTIANDKIKIELETDDIHKRLYIVEYPRDTIQYDPNNESGFLHELNRPHITKPEISGRKISVYHYALSCKAKQIFVFYNDKLVLCYGIKRTN